MAAHPHRVVIVGAGFGGLETAYRLAGAAVEITLIDRRNHHLFQPLLYQVATASLATSEIAWPIRHLMRDRRDVTTLFATVSGVDAERRLGEIDDRTKAIVGEHAEIGGRQTRIDKAKDLLAVGANSLEAQRSSLEDVDLSKVLLDLKTQDVNYQTAIAVTARVLQPTLMDFLR